MSDPLKPSAQLLIKLGSIAVHAEEFLSSDSHDFDRIALTTGLADPQVQEWIKAMDKMAFLPKKRKP